MSPRSLPLDALFGALITTVLGLVPFSELVGGCVAGYLHGRRGARVGALSGVFAAVPKSALLFVAAAMFGFVPTTTGGRALYGFLVILAAMVVFLAAMGALAGYLGAYLRRNRAG